MTQHSHKRIIVLLNDQLISAGVESFLAKQEFFDVFGIDTHDPQEIYEAINRIHPDIIIVDQNSQMPSLINLQSYIEDMPDIRTVVLNISNNQIQICDKRQVQINLLSDFIDILQ